ncbi:hypothetical protein ElyMa_001800200 [Elysia marginata]|uniref:Uncharacterized protein n=1 Tax=Elysia marginata TaxID=1093978 RepID=A0AAV4EFR5_9GAST|nr:hypothetical protein ElyMa_001800200 [Elysia marginata]
MPCSRNCAGILFTDHNAASTNDGKREKNFHGAAGIPFTEEKGSKSTMASSTAQLNSSPTPQKKKKSNESQVLDTSPADLRGYPKGKLCHEKKSTEDEIEGEAWWQLLPRNCKGSR